MALIYFDQPSTCEVNSIRIGDTSSLPPYQSGGLVIEKKHR